jgi:hypothetical protein
MFIDPHLNPSQHRYREFSQLLLSTAGRIHSPLIEIHRVCYIGSGPSRTILSEDEWKSVFQGAWASELRSAGFSLEVFIWDDFHDRYLISNLIGISVPYGFDTTTSLSSITTWTRLGRQDRDNIQREFDLASNRHVLRGRFRIPWNP